MYNDVDSLENVGLLEENHRKPRRSIKSDQPKILTETLKKSSVHTSFVQKRLDITDKKRY